MQSTSIEMDTFKTSYNDGADSDIDIGSDFSFSDVDVDDAIAKTVDNKVDEAIEIDILTDTEDTDIQTYPDISVGNGKYYQINLKKTDPKDAKNLGYPYTQKLIQVFIELRDSLGYTSKPPHTFRFADISEAIKTLQVEYAKEYNILFSYGYNIIKADALNPNNNFRSIIDLFKERDKAYGIKTKPVTNIPKPTLSLKRNLSTLKEPENENKENKVDKNKLDLSFLNKRRFGTSALNDIYTPKPQREPRKRDRLFVPEDAKQVTESSRIYGNSQIRRRKRGPRVPIIADPDY